MALPGSSVHEISQSRILEWVAIPSPRDLPDPRFESTSPTLADGFFTNEPPGKPKHHLNIVFLKIFIDFKHLTGIK